MNPRFAYLVHLLGWGLPVLLLQVGVLFTFHRSRWRQVVRAVLPPALISTVWLVAADHLAIREGIWRFGEGLHLGLSIGRVPIEEVLFFLVTNLLVAFGLALFAAPLGRRSARP